MTDFLAVPKFPKYSQKNKKKERDRERENKNRTFHRSTYQQKCHRINLIE